MQSAIDYYPFGQAAAFLWCQDMIYRNTLYSHSMDLEAREVALPRGPEMGKPNYSGGVAVLAIA